MPHRANAFCPRVCRGPLDAAATADRVANLGLQACRYRIEKRACRRSNTDQVSRCIETGHRCRNDRLSARDILKKLQWAHAAAKRIVAVGHQADVEAIDGSRHRVERNALGELHVRFREQHPDFVRPPVDPADEPEVAVWKAIGNGGEERGVRTFGNDAEIADDAAVR